MHTLTSLSFCPLVTEDTNKKRNKYDQWVSEVEHGLLSFQYLHGGMDPTTKVVYKKLASVIVTKHKQPYTVCITMLQAQFFLLSSIVCIRASHFSVNHPANSTLNFLVINPYLAIAGWFLSKLIYI